MAGTGVDAQGRPLTERLFVGRDHELTAIHGCVERARSTSTT